MQQIEQSIGRYLAAIDSADRARPEVAEAKAERLMRNCIAHDQQIALLLTRQLRSW